VKQKTTTSVVVWLKWLISKWCSIKDDYRTLVDLEGVSAILYEEINEDEGVE